MIVAICVPIVPLSPILSGVPTLIWDCVRFKDQPWGRTAAIIADLAMLAGLGCVLGGACTMNVPAMIAGASTWGAGLVVRFALAFFLDFFPR